MPDWMTRVRRVGSGIALAVAMGACTDNVGPLESPDRLLFVSSRDGVMAGGTSLSDIYRMHPDGSGVEKLTRDPSDYTALHATRDGALVVFAATRPFGGTWTATTDCPRRIWRMAADGSGLRAITSGSSCSHNPRLSPSGARIAYQRGNEIYLSDLNGGGETSLTALLPPVTPTSCGTTPIATVRLTGWYGVDRLSFWRHVCGVGTTHYTVGAGGQDLREIDLSSPRRLFSSPDASRVAYVLNGQQWVRNADGSGLRPLSAAGWESSGFDVEPSPWSPDGRHLVVRDSTGQFASLSVDGGRAQPIAGLQNALFGGWSTDGRRLAWTVYGAGTVAIHASGADGSGLASLTSGQAIDAQPLWAGTR